MSGIFICEDRAFNIKDYTFNSNTVNCGTSENTFLLKESNFVVRFKYESLTSQSDFRLNLIFNKKIIRVFI